MMEPLFIDAGDVLLIATRGDFLGQCFRQQRVEPAAYGIAAQDSEQLLHSRVPGFHNAVQIHGQHAHIEGLHDVFAEVLEAHDLQSFLLERGIELCVVESDGNVTGDGFYQLDVVA